MTSRHAWQRILIIFGRNVTDKVSNQKYYYATSNNLWFYTTWQKRRNTKIAFSIKCCISALPEFNQLLDFFMVALCNRADHYIFALWFLSSIFFFSSPNLSGRRLDVYHILLHMAWPSANLECRSEMCWSRLAANTGRKKVAKNRHLGTIAPLRRAISSQLRHVSTTEKKTC